MFPKFMRRLVGAALCGVVGLTSSASAQEQAKSPEIVRIWPGPAPGTADWTGLETNTPIQIPGEKPHDFISNVTVPTLTVFRPAAGKANGTGMIVIPGGGFQNLAVGYEGYDVASWLAERGVMAFVLKYRVRPSPGFAIPPGMREHPERFAEFAHKFDVGRPIAVADATQAMRYLRTNAKKFGLATDRIGMMGFSAGAITTIDVVLNASPAERPNFAAPIYGAILDDKPAPAGGPPLFLAVTQDDNAVPAVQTIAIFTKWTAANLPAELHVYERGGHGFGMRPVKAPVSSWTEPFEPGLARLDRDVCREALSAMGAGRAIQRQSRFRLVRPIPG
jgi:acetyl esterase/lipase